MTSPIPRGPLIAAAAACVFGCTAAEEAPPRSTVYDSAGVEVISNVGDGTLGGLHVEETLRLGVIDGEGPEQFAQIYAIALDEEGRIFVGNNGSGSIRAFGASGEFLREYGGRGEGPAEVLMVNEVLVSADTVALIDFQRGGKLILFSTDGEFIESAPLRNPDGQSVSPVHMGPGGWLSMVFTSNPPDLGRGESWDFVREVFEGGPRSTPGRHLYSIPIYTLYGTSAEGEGAVDWSLFDARSAWGFDDAGRLYITHPQTYRIDVHDRDGLRRSVRRAHEPRPITSADVEALKSAALHVMDTTSAMRDEMRADQRRRMADRLEAQAQLPLPAVQVPLQAILVSRDGSFWVRRSEPSALVQDEVEKTFQFFGGHSSRETDWDLYDSDGLLLGSVRLPSGFRGEAVDGPKIVGVLVDDLGVEYVVRFEALQAADSG